MGRAIQIKPEVAQRLHAEKRPVTYKEAGEDGCIFLLPHIMSFSWLMNDLAKDEKSFEGQRNQNPRPAGSITFNRILLLRSTVPHNMLPRQGPVSQTWDFAGTSKKKGTDYTTGSSVMWTEVDEISPLTGLKTGKRKTVGYVRKIVRDRFNNLTAAQAVVQLAVDERPFIIGVENASGAQYLEPTIIAEAMKTGDDYIIQICSHIDWISVDTQKDAKKLRMGQLYPWMVGDQFKFANFCMEPNPMEILYSEFEKCMHSHHHEDIPDVLAYQLRYAPQATQALVNNITSMFYSVDRQGWNELFSGDMVNAYYPDETGKLVPWYEPPPEIANDFLLEPEQPPTPHGLPNLMGFGTYG